MYLVCLFSASLGNTIVGENEADYILYRVSAIKSTINYIPMTEFLLVILLLEKSDLEVKFFVSGTLHKDYLKNHLLTYKWNQFSTIIVNELKKLQCKIILYLNLHTLFLWVMEETI